MRSRLLVDGVGGLVVGITSACAEQTLLWITSACAEQTGVACEVAYDAGDHLRVCGADFSALPLMVDIRGSPPRVRSRPAFRLAVRGRHGITSACAEQTSRR